MKEDKYVYRTKQLIGRCKNIRIFKLYRAQSITPAALAEIPQNMLDLEVLALYKCHVTDDALYRLLLAPKIKALKIVGSDMLGGSLAARYIIEKFKIPKIEFNIFDLNWRILKIEKKKKQLK